MLFSKTCPSCKRKVKKSELREAETATGRRITCCINCAKYFKVLSEKKWLELK